MNEASVAAYLPWLILWPLLGACGCMLAGRYSRGWALAVMAGQMILVCLALSASSTLSARTVALGGWSAPLGIALHGNRAALLFTALVAMLFLLVSVLEPGPRQMRQPGLFWALLLAMLGGLSGVVITRDLFNAYVLLEISGLAAVGLVALSVGHGAMQAALQYLWVNLTGSLCFLCAVALLYRVAGTLDLLLLASTLPVYAQQLTVWLACALITVGLLLKAALVPLHGWLPLVHGNARPAISALLSAVVVKVGVYLLVVLWSNLFALQHTALVAYFWAISGVLAIGWGTIQIWRAERLKMVAAYSTVSQLGYLFLFFPMLYALPEADSLIYHGVLMFMLAHALAKATLFLAIGQLKAQLGHDTLSAMQGIAYTQPLLVSVIAVAGISLIGLPPSAGFAGKWALLTLLAEAKWWGPFWLTIAASLASAIFLFRMLTLMLARPDPAPDPSPAAPGPTIPMSHYWLALLAGLIVVGGFVSQMLYRLLTGAV